MAELGSDPVGTSLGDFGGPANDRNDPSNSDQDDPRERRLGARGRLGDRDRDRRRVFTPAELAAEAARRELLRLLASQGTGATILRSSPGPVSGASIFGSAPARTPAPAPVDRADRGPGAERLLDAGRRIASRIFEV